MGAVIAIGGNEDKSGTPESILSLFVQRAGGSSARIVIIPFASSFPVERGETYRAIFRRFGAEEVLVLQDGGLMDTDFSPLETATGIFVTGGDQSKLMLLLAHHGYVEAIHAAVQRGAVYAGTSAGAAAVSGPMITGWSRNQHGTKVRFGNGLALAPGVIIDQHFSERRRLPRLQRAVQQWNLTGVGIDENTAAIWEGRGRISVFGAGTVTVVNPSADAHVTLRSGEVLELESEPDGSTLVR